MRPHHSESHEPDGAVGVALSTIARELGNSSVIGDASTRVLDVQQDSRKVKPGDLFVSRPGAASDAQQAQHVRQALERGARAILRATGVTSGETSTPTIEVEPTRLRAATGVAASAVHGHPSFALDVIAVTGTNGKTTSTWLLASALNHLQKASDRGLTMSTSSCAIVGTVEARFGDRTLPTSHTTPDGDELARLLAWARHLGAHQVALEASSHALDQDRLAGTRVRAAAFTNLTQDHLDYHSTMEAYFQAKRRLFTELQPGFAAIVVDGEYGRRLANETRVPKLTVAIESRDADVHVLAAKFSEAGIEAELATPSGRATLTSALVGPHNLSNLALSLGVMLGLNFPLDPAIAALSVAEPARGRLQRASAPGLDDITVLVDYAHTPDALDRALAALRPLTKGRLVCVFGCGGDRDATKRGPMGRAVLHGADLAIVTSDNPRTEDPRAIVEQILDGLGEFDRIALHELDRRDRGVAVELDRATAISESIAHARAGDVVLIAGKGHEDYQIIGTDKRRFDDLEEAQR
ncbi:MAG: UDP-N-acetylmuramoyl-L-alanyl-D-glutamate--2,6-diaminopimelate ligase, partial [Polyangiales bacterium]